MAISDKYEGMREIRNIDDRNVVDSFALYAPLHYETTKSCQDMKFDIHTPLENLCCFLPGIRIKRACWPNCWSTQLGDLLVIRAARRLRAGDEVTIQDHPINLKKYRAVRKCDENSCQCVLCQMERLDDPKLIDKRRRLIEQFEHWILNIPGRNGPYTDEWVDTFDYADSTIDQIKRSYSHLPSGSPKVALAHACVLMVELMADVRGKHCPELAEYCRLGWTALGWTLRVSHSQLWFERWGIPCREVALLFESAYNSCLHDPFKSKSFVIIRNMIWTILTGMPKPVENP